MNKKILLALFLIVTLSMVGNNAHANTSEYIDQFAQNRIRFYKPDDYCGTGDITGECGGEITSTDVEGRLREVTEKYGILAMKLQEETGVPWELVFAQMVHESSMGLCTNCVASHVEELGGFNWLGLSYTGIGFYNKPEPYDAGKTKWSIYSSIENMMAGYAIDFLRNRIYSDAFQYSSASNFDLKQFFYAEIAHYCPSSDGCNHHNYWNAMKWAIDISDEVAKQKGWPNSEEFAKQKNIPVGGKYPDVKSDIHEISEFSGIEPHSLNMECASNNTSSGGVNEDTGVTADGNKVTLVGDSISVHAKKELQEAMPGIDIDAISGSMWSGTWRADKPDGLSRLKGKGDKIRSVVVFALGTNDDDVTEQDFKDLMGIVGTKRKVVLMNFYNRTDSGKNSAKFNEKNEHLKKYAARYSNIVIADWLGPASKDPKKYMMDPLHPTDDIGCKLFAKIIAQAVNGTTGKQAVSATWSNGWVTSGIEGYKREEVIGNYTPGDSEHLKDFKTKNPKDGTTFGPNKITLHNTEGGDGGGTSGLVLYGQNGFPAHFTINLKSKTVFQHHPITKPANSIASYDYSAGVQIEIIGFSSKGHENDDWYILDKAKFTKEEWAYLAKLLVAIGQETGIPMDTSVDWENPQRLAAGEDFDSYNGILAHMHTPAPNDHTDTGNIWPMLKEALDSIQASTNTGFCGAQEKAWSGDDFPWWDQCDEKWANTDYGGCGTTCSSGCGVTSFAMMATALTGKEHLPDEVTKVAGSKGLHVCGAGSSWTLPLVLAPEYGLEAENIDGASIDQINAKLRSGYMIWTCGNGSNPFTRGGHCIGIRGITNDGKWLLADSNGEKGRVNSMETEWDPSSVYPRMNNCKAIKAR